jgi:tRNA(Ile)-lysidine synthase
MKKQDLVAVIKNRLAAWGVERGESLVVAVSGGVDSMVLLQVMADLSKKKGYLPVVAHINHGLRKTADRDEKLVHKTAIDNGLEFVSAQVKILGKTGIEEKARKARYKALRGIAEQFGARFIVTAHNANDQAETIVFNFLRGAGIRGLGGMREVAEGIFRPMLSVSKAEILQYAKRHKIKYFDDETNKLLDFTRNRIRHQLLPELTKYNPKIYGQLNEMGKLLQRAEQAIRISVQLRMVDMATRKKDTVVFSASKFRELDDFTQAEMLKVALESLGADLEGLKRSHFEEAAKFVAGPSGRAAKRRIGGKLFIEKGYDKITVGKK